MHIVWRVGLIIICWLYFTQVSWVTCLEKLFWSYDWIIDHRPTDLRYLKICVILTAGENLSWWCGAEDFDASQICALWWVETLCCWCNVVLMNKRFWCQPDVRCGRPCSDFHRFLLPTPFVWYRCAWQVSLFYFICVYFKKIHKIHHFVCFLFSQ